MTQNKFPSGWDEKKVREIIEYYDSQTDEEVAAEIAAVCEGYTMVEVPIELVALVASLVARYERGIPLEVLKDTIRNMPVEAHYSA
jgi:hypothetical protein